MKTLNGINIKRQDLKKEGSNYVFFKQLEDLRKENKDAKAALTDKLFDRYDSLLINPEDELLGLKDGQTTKVDKIKGAFSAAQTLFSE